MTIRSLSAAVALLVLPAYAMAADAMQYDHGGATYHAMRLETDVSRQQGRDVVSWDLDGWIGGDIHKLWLKSEGEVSDNETDQAELWALYSRNIATFWDAQIGLRHDFTAENHTYLTMGVMGLAPYFFETEAHVFVRDDGALSARLREENDLLLTNRLIAQPYAEVNLNTQKDAEAGLGTGLTDLQIGVQTRYELTRGFAPYVDLQYARKFGQTADYTRAKGEKVEATALKLGIRWLF